MGDEVLVVDHVQHGQRGDGRDRAAGEGAEELRLVSERLDVAAAGDDGGDRVAVAHRLAERDDVGRETGAGERPQVVPGPAEPGLHLVGHHQRARRPRRRPEGLVVRRARASRMPSLV